ncbi:hypothetical protein ACFV16_22465 [Streptomyces massasporeus]|uniref:hypothetical protein n=1 Tax=Streptomyces massasporeus TaxID=67324 RepID=UPI0036BFF2B7
MTTTLERLATEPKHDPAVLLPNVWDDLLRTVRTACPCGNTASVRDGKLVTHEPASTWDHLSGQQRTIIRDACGNGYTCRYSGRTVTLAAALERDNVLTDAERRVRDTTRAQLEAGITDTAPEGCTLPKQLAALLALADANGWRTAQAWVPERDYETRERLDGEFTVNVRISRAGGWQYDLSYYVAPGVARRTRFGLCTTPDRRGQYDTPSLKAITAAIRANPVTEG